MKKGTRKTSTILLIIFLLISGYAIYDLFLFDYFNDKRLEHKKVELVDNYFENENSFKKFSSYIEGIGNVQNLKFYENNQISFSVFSKNHDQDEATEPLEIEINNDSITLDIDYQFNKDNSITISVTDTIVKFNDWHFYVDTDQNDKKIEQLLEYINVSQEKLNTIRKELRTLNCKALTKNDQLIKFRYAGHFGESLDYIIPLNQKEIESEITIIKDRFHYGITSDFIYCGITKW